MLCLLTVITGHRRRICQQRVVTVIMDGLVLRYLSPSLVVEESQGGVSRKSLPLSILVKT